MIEIPLRNRRGEVVAHALVDEADAAQAEHRWHLSKGYAVRSVTIAPGRQTAVLLHRAILGLGYGDPRQTDHENRDRLDCRRSNLRITTHAGNTQNVGANHGSTSRYRGVSWTSRDRKWCAQAQVNGRNRWLGQFDSEEDAAAAAAAFRAEHMPFSEEAAA